MPATLTPEDATLCRQLLANEIEAAQEDATDAELNDPDRVPEARAYVEQLLATLNRLDTAGLHLVERRGTFSIYTGHDDAPFAVREREHGWVGGAPSLQDAINLISDLRSAR